VRIADHEDGLRIIDASDVQQLREIGHYDMSAAVWDVDIGDGYAYVAAGNARVCVLDVRTASNPLALGAFPTPGYARGVDVNGLWAYVAAEAVWEPRVGIYIGGGLWVANVSDPSRQPPRSSLQTLSKNSQADAVEATGYCADRYCRAHLFTR